MKNLTKIFVGVDISKDTLAVHVLPLGESFVFENNAKGMKKFIATLAPHDVGQIVCEATGGYETYMLNILKKNEYKTWLVEPKRIKAFAYSRAIRTKTDAIDAQTIAHFAANMIQEHEQIYERNQELHLLVNRKANLTEMMKQEKVRLQHPQENCKKDIKTHIAFLKKQINALERRINEVVEKDEDLSKKAAILVSMPGVGKKTAAVLIAEMPELGKIENKKISALIGVAPYAHESGKFKGKAVISGGRAFPRTSLFMIALVASKSNKTFRQFYLRLLAAGKSKKLALTALMRKIITILNTMLRNGTLWNENIT